VIVNELFTQRYQARIESGELFADDLYLQDYRLIKNEAEDRHWTDEATEHEHVNAEQVLRTNIWRLLGDMNAKTRHKDLLDRTRQHLSDAYLQGRRTFLGARQGLLSEICDEGLDWVFEQVGLAPELPPFNSSKWSIAANLIVFDYVEVLFSLLASNEQLDFSRELNTRLSRGASRWYFQLGRWRREDWPRDRDAEFDLILYSLRRQADAALERRLNSHPDDGPLPEDFDPAETAQALQTAAHALWQADRLLTSDLLTDKVRHNSAVRAARSALDACLNSFGSVARGPFVFAKPPRDLKKRKSNRRGRKTDDTKPAKNLYAGVETPSGAAERILKVGLALDKIAHSGMPKEEEKKFLQRANLAEFLLRLALFGLPSDKDDLEDADMDEVRRFSKITGEKRTPLIGGTRFNHGQGTVHLQLQDKATARLAVDLIARLCQYATGAAPNDQLQDISPSGSSGRPSGHDLDRAREIMIFRTMIAILGVLGVAGLVALSYFYGVNIGETNAMR
jgi:hypothetical protein